MIVHRLRRLDWSPALRAAGLPNHRIYDLRTSFLTWGVEAGLDLGTLADIAGTSIMQLSNTYVRPTAHSKRAAMAAVDGRKAASR